MKIKQILSAALLLMAVVVISAWAVSSRTPKFTTPYQAVLLANGSVYFGKLEGLGTNFPVLHDVYYVQSGVDTQTKEPKSILLRRGSEWHAPDHMVLNASQIVLVEPVGAGSRVAALIAQSK